MKHFKDLSIKAKLTTSYVLVVMLTVLIFAVTISVKSRHVVNHLAERNVEQVMISSTQHIQTLMKDINSSLLSFQTKEAVQNTLSQTHKSDIVNDVSILESAMHEIDMFQDKISKSELYVIGRDDYPQINSLQSVFSDKQLKNDVWYNSMRYAGNTTKWIIRDAHNSNDAYIVASKLIHDVNTGQPVAVLKSNIDMQNFTDYLDSIILADTGKMFLCSDSHIVNRTDSALGNKLVNNPVIFRDMLAKSDIETRTITLDNEKWLVKSYPLYGSDIFILGVVKINEFNSAQGAIVTAMLTTGILLFLLSITLILFITTMITKPLSILSKRMQNYTIEHNNTIHPDSQDEIGVLFESFNSMNETILQLIKNVQYETEIRKIANLRALQAQITPHFLYNTLNSISALAKKYNANDIEKMTFALSRFFMHSLNNGADMITLGNEFEQVMSYVYLQKIRYGNRFEVNITADDDVKEYLICKLTLQPLVENCIYHAFTDIDYTGVIEIKAIHKNDNIIITVSDNGIGNETIDFEKINEYVNKSFDLNEPIEKYGIHNISQRIKLYFGEEYGISYLPNPDMGITVKITVKAIKKSDDAN